MTNGERISEAFLEKEEINAWGVYQRLRQDQHFRGRYGWVVRLFYALRVIGLIEFTKSVPGNTPIDRRFYRVVPGRLNDHRWRTPYSELYPAASLGALNYEPGRSVGRAKRYETPAS